MTIKKEVIQAIEVLGLVGKSVCIHSSMRSFKDQRKQMAEILLESFLETKCTVMVPTFSYAYEVAPIEPYMPERNGAGDYSYFLKQKYENKEIFSVYSKEISAEDMGIFPQHLLKQEMSVRGKHPLNSFSAIGSKSTLLIQNQNEIEVYAPFEKLCEENGSVVLIGVDLNHATIIHYAEQLAGRRLFVRWARDEQGEVIGVNVGSCSDGFNYFKDLLAPIEQRIQVNDSEWLVYNAREMLKICTEEIRRYPMSTHCTDDLCYRCNDAVRGGPIYR